MNILCACKDSGDLVKLCYTNDPFRKFQSLYGSPAVLTRVDNSEIGMAAITHPQPDIVAGINLELKGVLLYGPVLLINIDYAGQFTSLTEEQLDVLRECASLA